MVKKLSDNEFIDEIITYLEKYKETTMQRIDISVESSLAIVDVLYNVTYFMLQKTENKDRMARLRKILKDVRSSDGELMNILSEITKDKENGETHAN